MVQKRPLFVNVYTIENVNAGGAGVDGQKKSKSCQRNMWTTPWKKNLTLNKAIFILDQ